jgi:hypothetical protein
MDGGDLQSYRRKPGTIPGGRPVRKMAARSARCLAGGIDCSLAFSTSRLGKTPGYKAGSRSASNGKETSLTNWLSLNGQLAFHLSFIPSETSTSLNSGIPRRDTCS